MPTPEYCWRPELLSAVPGGRIKPWQTPSPHSKVVLLALSIGLGQGNYCGAPNPCKSQDPAATTKGKVNRTSSSWWKWSCQAPAGVASLTLRGISFPSLTPLPFFWHTVGKPWLSHFPSHLWSSKAQNHLPCWETSSGLWHSTSAKRQVPSLFIILSAFSKSVHV